MLGAIAIIGVALVGARAYVAEQQMKQLQVSTERMQEQMEEMRQALKKVEKEAYLFSPWVRELWNNRPKLAPILHPRNEHTVEEQAQNVTAN